MKNKILIAIAVAAVVLLGYQELSKDNVLGAAGVVQTNPVWFYNGLDIGNPAITLNADSDGLSVSGATVFDSSLTVTGATVLGTLTQGGGIATVATTSTSYTLLASQFDTENVLDVTPGGASLTLTLPATSTLTSFVPTAGQTRSVFIRNATTTAGINITVASGTGTVLRSASSTAIIQSDTAGAKGARLDFVRRTNGDISVFMVPYNN